MQIKCLDNTSDTSKDVVIITAPLTGTDIPLMAPAALKPIVEKAGLSCLAVDLNAEVYNLVRNHPKQNEIMDFLYKNLPGSDDINKWLEDLFESTATQTLSFNPRIVCVSVFSYACQTFTRWIAYYLKKINPDIQIIIGGAGCLNTFTGPSGFVKELLESKLVDYHVRGDGEHTLYELLKGNDQYPGINDLEWKQLDNEELAKIPLPDYSDYDFTVYDKQVLPLLGSRGCVRQCTFCDYIANWKKFQWRTAEDIFDEIMEQHRLYGFTSFKFQDSLTNGNQKEFRRLIELMAEYNDTADIKLEWGGYYIFREWDSKSASDWELVYKSGGNNLIVGIENLNQDIRYSLGKKFSNEAIDLHLAEAKKYGIYLILLNIVGYVNETREHIDYIRSWLDSHTEYQDGILLHWGGTLGIFPNTYLEANKDALGIKMIGDQPQHWVNESVKSTPELRASWAREINQYSRDLGYKIITEEEDLGSHYILEMLINGEDVK